jgi:hypothetical protein
MQTWIARAVEKMERLTERSDLHGDPADRLRPQLRPEELASLEHGYGITLPDDYRDFLLEAGSGGAGLSEFKYVPTADRPDGGWDPILLLSADPGALARPFPLTSSILYDHELAMSLPEGTDYWKHVCPLRWDDGDDGRYPWDGALYLTTYG